MTSTTKNSRSLLDERKQDFKEAKIYYQKALDAKPNEELYLGSFGSFLFCQGNEEKGEDYLLKALNSLERKPVYEDYYLGFLVESYIYLHKKSGRKNLGIIKTLIKRGVRVEGWLGDNIFRWAEREKHFNMKFIEQLTKVLKDEEDMSTLEKFKEWR